MKSRIILEIGYNHNGSIDLAQRMIEDASKLRVWGVKFQKWNFEGFPDDIKALPREHRNSFGSTYYDHRKALEFSIEELDRLRRFALSCGLEFVCSGKDATSIKELVAMGCQNIKVPAQRFSDKEIFDLLKDSDARVMVSTGMHADYEIQFSPWWGVADVVMHCISLYPAPLDSCCLSYMRKVAFNGYSSHETEGRAIKYAVMLGANWIERHFTFDKAAKGSDHAISSDYEEIERIKNEIEEAEEIRGQDVRIVTAEEKKAYEFYGRF